MHEYTEFETFTDYPIFDADQHLLESPDCYTRHIPKEYAERTLRMLSKDGQDCILVEGALLPSDVYSGKMARPGSLKEMLRGIKSGSPDAGTYEWMVPDPVFSAADQRLDMLDRQNIEACLLYSNDLGLLAEHLIEDDDLYYASSWSYLRYLDEEWGFARANRMFVAPVFSLRRSCKDGRTTGLVLRSGREDCRLRSGTSSRAFARRPIF